MSPLLVALGIPLAVVLVAVVSIGAELVMDEAFAADVGRRLGESRQARARRAGCRCCHGYPVCWVDEEWSSVLEWVPADELCSRHTNRWLYIHALESELLESRRPAPQVVDARAELARKIDGYCWERS